MPASWKRIHRTYQLLTLEQKGVRENECIFVADMDTGSADAPRTYL